MHIPRLKHLAEVARAIPERKLNMEYWGRISLNEPIETKDLPLIASPVECHTACCLLGWAAFDPKFKEEGLVWRKTEQPDFQQEPETTDPLDYYTISFNDSTFPLSAGQVFFGLTFQQTKDLFRSGYDMTGAQKATQIEEMINAYS